jgi:hypothetical protein
VHPASSDDGDQRATAWDGAQLSEGSINLRHAQNAQIVVYNPQDVHGVPEIDGKTRSGTLAHAAAEASDRAHIYPESEQRSVSSTGLTDLGKIRHGYLLADRQSMDDGQREGLMSDVCMSLSAQMWSAEQHRYFAHPATTAPTAVSAENSAARAQNQDLSAVPPIQNRMSVHDIVHKILCEPRPFMTTIDGRQVALGSDCSSSSMNQTGSISPTEGAKLTELWPAQNLMSCLPDEFGVLIVGDGGDAREAEAMVFRRGAVVSIPQALDGASVDGRGPGGVSDVRTSEFMLADVASDDDSPGGHSVGRM